MRDRGTPLMMHSHVPPCSLHGGSAACRALRHLVLLHGHLYRGVTSSCLSQRGHAFKHGTGATSPGAVATTIFPSRGTPEEAARFSDGGLAAVSIYSARVCATPCPACPGPSGALRKLLAVAVAWTYTAPLTLLSTASVACASAKMLPIFRKSPSMTKDLTSW